MRDIMSDVVKAKRVEAKVFLYDSSREYIDPYVGWTHTRAWILAYMQARLPCELEVRTNISHEIIGMTKPSIRKPR